jgi:L-lactate dehydrogenase
MVFGTGCILGVCYIADAILNRRATIVSVNSVLNEEYGVDNIALSLPSIIGVNGVVKRIVVGSY